MAAVQAMLAQVGINVVPRAVDTPTYNGIVYAANPSYSQFPLVYAGLQNGPDPSGNSTSASTRRRIPLPEQTFCASRCRT